MTIVRWDPFREMGSLQNAMERLFEESIVSPSRLRSELTESVVPSLDIYQTENNVVIKVALAGVKPEEMDISVSGDVLTIKGKRQEEEVSEGEYIRRELPIGPFNRSVALPVQTQSEKAKAAFENGILTLTLPKAEAVKARQIKVVAKEVIEGTKNS